MNLAIWLVAGALLFGQSALSQNQQVTLNGVFYPAFSVKMNLQAPGTLQNEFSPLSQTAIEQLFKIAQNSDLPFDYVGNCCFERGYRISQLFNAQGVKSLRVIARGKMKTSMVDKWGLPIYWEKHTSVALVDKNKNLWIIDPSLAEKPLLLKDWLSLFVDESVFVELLVGNQFVFDEEDLFSNIKFNNYQRAHVEEIVKSSLFGCQFIQDRNNQRLKKVTPQNSCQILPQSFEHSQKNEVSDFWAQELIGLDLAKEWISQRRSQNTHRPLVHIWDEAVELSEPDNRGRVNHAYSVQSFFELGPQSASEVAVIFNNQDVIYDYRGYITGAENLEFKSETQLINLSAGWRSYVDSIKNALDLVGQKNTIIVKAAGNRPLRASGEAEFEPERSDFVRVGSLAPNGLITDYSALRGDWIIYAPSDRFLTARASPSGQFTRFDGTSGAAPLVTGALANYLSMNPKASREKIQKSLISSAFEFRNESGQTHHYVINSFRLLFTGLDIKTYQREAQPILWLGDLAKNKLKNQFPSCFGLRINTKNDLQSCQDSKHALKDYRRSFYLEPKAEMAQEISCIYKTLGFKKESQFYSNWAASHLGQLERHLRSQLNLKSVIARNAGLLSLNDLKVFFKKDLSQKIEIGGDFALALFIRPDIK
ncbi:MAG: S8 family serine peptidase, partial [Bdellovibrionales bacterium]